MPIVNGKTKIAGLIGNPVEHTKSPAMHNKGYDLLGLNYQYIPLHVEADDLEAAVKGVRGLSFAGVNVTIPYKEDVIKYLDELDDGARLIGAVNTIVNDNGKLIGYNTDGPGFVRDAKESLDFDFSEKKMLLLGSGGAARAIAVTSLQEGISSLMIVDLDTDKSEELASHLKANFDVNILISTPETNELYEFAGTIDILVNATPVGMHPNVDRTPIKDISKVAQKAVVYDVIYSPLKTLLMQQMEERGHKCANGLGMLAGQGAIGFEKFTGKQISTAKMIQFLNES